jgi:protein SCO1/2
MSELHASIVREGIKPMTKFLFAAFGCALLFCASLQAQTKASESPASKVQNSARAASQAEPSPAQKYFTDVELVNQDGAKMRFYSDLLKGRTVVIISFFTTCTGVCPPMNRNMAKIQEALGDRLGKQVNLISISVDPVTDTPARLNEYAAKFHARPGWYFVTGTPENVKFALNKIGQYVADKNDHTSIMIIGNEATGLWKKAFALAQAEELIKIVTGVADDKGEGAK